MAYSYRCKDYPGMDACPASFTAETESELWKHIELHGAHAQLEGSGHRRERVLGTMGRVAPVGDHERRLGQDG